MMDLVTLVLACSLYTNNSIPYAMIQTGSQNDPLAVTVDQFTQHFKKKSEAIRYTQQQRIQGKAVAIGLMQVSSQQLPKDAPIADLFHPCKNLVVATQIMNQLHLHCQTLAEHNPTLDIPSCMLSMYATGDAQTGLTYAHQVIDFAAQHPFSALVEKARDPDMVATVTHPEVKLYTYPSSTRRTTSTSKTS